MRALWAMLFFTSLVPAQAVAQAIAAPVAPVTAEPVDVIPTSKLQGIVGQTIDTQNEALNGIVNQNLDTHQEKLEGIISQNQPAHRPDSAYSPPTQAIPPSPATAAESTAMPLPTVLPPEVLTLSDVPALSPEDRQTQQAMLETAQQTARSAEAIARATKEVAFFTMLLACIAIVQAAMFFWQLRLLNRRFSDRPATPEDR